MKNSDSVTRFPQLKISNTALLDHCARKNYNWKEVYKLWITPTVYTEHTDFSTISQISPLYCAYDLQPWSSGSRIGMTSVTSPIGTNYRHKPN